METSGADEKKYPLVHAVTPIGDKGRKGGRLMARKANPVVGNNVATVVVVDDDPSVLNALARLIRALGFKVATFDRPTALLASVIPAGNACLVVDINLPEMNGIELCWALAESGRELPAIFITGRSDEATRRLVEQAQFVAILYKPIDESPLLDAITSAVDLSKPDRCDG